MRVSKISVFLDRDDTIIRDIPYLNNPEMIEILPGAPEAIRMLNMSHISAIIVTNQSGIARGLLSEELLEVIHRRMRALFREKNADIDAIYYCPHHPEGIVEPYRKVCGCRKPAPGMLLQAATDYGLDLKHCYLVGNNLIDINTIHSVGGKGALIAKEGGPTAPADYVAKDLIEAVRWILLDIARII